MTTTPAQELAAAATRLRSLAAEATPGPWKADPSIPYGHRVGSSDDADWVARTGEYGEDYARADSDWIAAMHPGVGAALAQLLDRWAWLSRADPDLLNRVGGPEALVVARLINGTAGGA